MELNDPLAASQVVQAINVLSDECKGRTASCGVEICFHISQGSVRSIGLAFSDQAAPPVVPLPDELWIAPKGGWCSQVLSAVGAPQTSFTTKRWHTTLGGDTSASQDGSSLAVGVESAQGQTPSFTGGETTSRIARSDPPVAS
jgi:hypothetical protein